jgi:hypothetical protein
MHAIVGYLSLMGHLFEWCGQITFKNGTQSDTCLKEIGPSARFLVAILDLIVNTIGKPRYSIKTFVHMRFG